MAKNKPHRELIIPVNCSCGLIHHAKLALGEIQVLGRAIIKGKTPSFKIRITTYGPTGRTNKDGSPEYVEFNLEREKKVDKEKREPDREKECLEVERQLRGTRPGTEHLTSRSWPR